MQARNSRNFTSYLVEFILLALAVFLGFFIEGQRRLIISNKNEKNKINTIITEFRTETAAIEKGMRVRSSRYAQLDSMVMIFKDKKIFGHENELYFFAKMITKPVNYLPYDPLTSYEEFGQNRMNSDPVISDSLKAYQKYLLQFEFDQEYEYKKIYDVSTLVAKIFDPYELDKMVATDGSIRKPTTNPFLRNADNEIINDLVYHIQDYKSALRADIIALRKLQFRANRLIAFLENYKP
jgi:hypothetical protein